MAIVTIGSNNPQFSHIICKNPATIRDSGKAFRREARKGVVYGWYTDKGAIVSEGGKYEGGGDQEFRLWFKDNETESSFTEGPQADFEYLDCTRYGSPYAPVSIIQVALPTASKKQDEMDAASYLLKTLEDSDDERLVLNKAYLETTIKVPTFRFLQQMATHFEGQAAISYRPLGGLYYHVRVEAPTVFLVLNVIQVVCLLQCLTDPDTYIEKNRTAIDRYIRVLNNAKAPYYARYLFQMKAINNRDMFKQLKSELELPGMDLKFGDTRQQRFDAISPYLNGKETLIDIGCGEMFYTIKKAGAYDVIFAVDADQERAENNTGKVKGRGIENIVTLHATANVDWVNENESLFTGADVLLTEVAEHMTFEEATLLIECILNKDIRRLVVTCPNKDFNKHYGLSDEEMRHTDHQWEPTYEEFCDWVVGLYEVGYDCHMFGIGDSVNDSSTTCMAVFDKKPEEELNEIGT